MSRIERLRRRRCSGRTIQVAVVGAGFVGRALVRRIEATPGMRVAVVINRRAEPAVRALVEAGHPAGDVCVAQRDAALAEAIVARRPVVTTRAEAIPAMPRIDVVVEATGAVEHGAQVALHAIAAHRHVVMVNAETDATVGPALRRLADEAGVIYTGADGDQPAVLMRLIGFVEEIGLDPIAAMNCKGYLDRSATPRTIVDWSRRQGTSLSMTTSFTDGTKMNLENAVLSNATGLLPSRRGMVGVRSTLAAALADCVAAVPPGSVDYTLGGDFGGGVLVIGRCDRGDAARSHLRYYKMGDGPEYLFHRPYHLCHFEVPATIADVMLDGSATIAPIGHCSDVVALAKRDLAAGEQLDGIGGFTCYGEIDTVADAAAHLPIGLAAGARLVRAVRRDEPIALDAVELDEDSTLVQLRRFQAEHVQTLRTAA